jgi:peroxiredoxin (alkyl hydroperoxide reductase subunit C)
MSLIGRPAPEWRANSYLKGQEVQRSSADYRGRWHLLYWYPLDFTFICPTEIRGFQELLSEFNALGVDVIGASTDSWHSHNAWFADRKIFPQPITHPVLADTNHSVSRAFEVLKLDDGIAYRGTVIVDDRGIVRSAAVNDLSVGRSPSEVLRTVQALQSGGLCGADWRKGDAFAA